GTAAALEAHHAIDEREERVITPAAHVLSRVELGAALPHEDVARQHALPAESLHAEPLRVRVAAVAARADSLLVRHAASLSRAGSRRSGPRCTSAGVPASGGSSCAAST